MIKYQQISLMSKFGKMYGNRLNILHFIRTNYMLRNIKTSCYAVPDMFENKSLGQKYITAFQKK